MHFKLEILLSDPPQKSGPPCCPTLSSHHLHYSLSKLHLEVGQHGSPDRCISLCSMNKYESISPCIFLQCYQTLVFSKYEKKNLLILIYSLWMRLCWFSYISVPFVYHILRTISSLLLSFVPFVVFLLSLGGFKLLRQLILY